MSDIKIGDRVRVKRAVGSVKKGDEFTVIDTYRFGPEVFIKDHRPANPVRFRVDDLEVIG